MDEVDASVDEFYDIISEVCTVVDTENDIAIDESVEEMDEQAEEFKEYLGGIEDEAKEKMDAQITGLEDSLAFANQLVIITMILVLVFGLIFTFAVSKSISAPRLRRNHRSPVTCTYFRMA